MLATGKEKDPKVAQLAEVTQLAQTLELPGRGPSQKRKWLSD